MTREERVEQIEEAIKMIEQAKEMVEMAIDGTVCENNFIAYGCYGLDTALGLGNKYDSSIPDLLKVECGCDNLSPKF